MEREIFFCGGDVSKGYCDFTILNHLKQPVEENFQLDDTAQGHQKLLGIIEQFQKRHPMAELYVGFESTGGYENNWYQLFLEFSEIFDIHVTRLNPLGVKRHKQASMERNDTDKISARKIAEYLILYPEKAVYNQKDSLAPIRRHWRLLRILKKQRAQLLGHLEKLMYVAHPQLLKYCRSEISGWLINVLIKFPTAHKLAQAKIKKLTEISYVNDKRGISLIQEARSSVASAALPEMEVIIRTIAQQIYNLGQAIKLQEQQMMKSYQVPQINILTSFAGIAQSSAIGLLIEIGDLQRFPSVKHLASFAGIHPVLKESGDGTKKVRMSKKGRKEIRYILFNIARTAIVHNEMIKELYENYVQRGIKKMVAIGIIMHKILRIIYGMLKNKKKYDPQVDKANRDKNEKKKTKQKIQNVEKSRRYQTYDHNAPISGRQKRKRDKKTGKSMITKQYSNCT